MPAEAQLGSPRKAPSDSGDAADAAEGDHDVTKRRPKRRAPNIFKSFSDSHNNNLYLSRVEIESGRVRHRVQARKFWQSERDLARWQQSLKDASRHHRSLDSEKARWNPNYHREKNELLTSHNESSRQHADRFPKPKVAPTSQLKDLQQQIAPGFKASRSLKKLQADGLKHGSRHSMTPEQVAAGAETSHKDERLSDHDKGTATKLVAGLVQKYGSLKNLFEAMDINGNGALSLNEFSAMVYRESPELRGASFPVSTFWSSMDADENGLVNMKEFEARLAPFVRRASREKRRELQQQKAWEAEFNAYSEDHQPGTAEDGERRESEVPTARSPATPSKSSSAARLQPLPEGQEQPDSPRRSSPRRSLAQALAGAPPRRPSSRADTRAATGGQGSRPVSRPATIDSEGSLENVAFSVFFDELELAESGPAVDELKESPVPERRRKKSVPVIVASPRTPPPEQQRADPPKENPRRRAGGLKSQSHKELPNVKLPQTRSLLVFRNADPMHCGEPVLVKRWPLGSVKELLATCSEVCRPYLAPAATLLTLDLVPLRSLEDVLPGTALLLKGAEGLDPPPLFLKQRAMTNTRSLGQLTKARADIAEQLLSDGPVLRAQTASGIGSARSSRHLSSTMSSTAPHGSPPRSQGVPLTRVPKTGKWEEPAHLSMMLSWGGLSRKNTHHDYSTWGRVFDHHERSTDSFLGATM